MLRTGQSGDLATDPLGCPAIICLTAPRMSSGVDLIASSVRPTPSASIRAAFIGWSAPIGSTTSGTPCARSPVTLPEPSGDRHRVTRSLPRPGDRGQRQEVPDPPGEPEQHPYG
jgi:hypothetical protein